MSLRNCDKIRRAFENTRRNIENTAYCSVKNNTGIKEIVLKSQLDECLVDAGQMMEWLRGGRGDLNSSLLNPQNTVTPAYFFFFFFTFYCFAQTQETIPHTTVLKTILLTIPRVIETTNNT